MKAYRLRVRRNHNMLLEFADKLRDQGCDIYMTTSVVNATRLVSWMLIVKDGKHCTFGFEEVPYRWRVGVSFLPSKGKGSGRTCFTDYNTDEINVTLEEMLPYMLTAYKPNGKPLLFNMVEENLYNGSNIEKVGV